MHKERNIHTIWDFGQMSSFPGGENCTPSILSISTPKAKVRAWRSFLFRHYTSAFRSCLTNAPILNMEISKFRVTAEWDGRKEQWGLQAQTCAAAIPFWQILKPRNWQKKSFKPSTYC